jgi:membrane protease YdiL (CAAX protease family)
VPAQWNGARLIVPVDCRAVVDSIVASLRRAHVAPPGWYPDPWQLVAARWWDGNEWSGHVLTAPPTERSWIPPRGSRELAMRGGGIAFVGFVVAVAASTLTVLATKWLGGSVRSLEALVASELVLWACLFAACKIAVHRHGSGSLRDLGLRKTSRREVGAGLVVGLVTRLGAGALAVALAQLFTDEQSRNTSEPVVKLQQGIWPFVVVVLILVVGAPFFEELFFRGLVQGAFTNRTGARVALFTQAVCFGAVHYRVGMSAGQALITVVTIGATGLALGATRWHYDKLGPGMVAHAFFNAFVVVLVIALA